jgi:tetraacyldisaccharide 4'-kinase
VRFTDEFILSVLAQPQASLGIRLLRGGLALTSLPYEWVVRARNRLFETGWLACKRAAVPVISVGNLTVGGTGKTPCVEYIAKLLSREGYRVVILSRGFGRSGPRNDEASVLEENLPGMPHLQGADRVELAMVAVNELSADVLILDDGFQHRRLMRDLDLVLIDCSSPWGLGKLLPRGLLREPPTSLDRADIIVLTRCDQVDKSMLDRIREQVAQLTRNKPVVQTVHGPMDLISNSGSVVGVNNLAGRPIAAFCGIGNPQAFRRTLTDLGAVVKTWQVFPDHQNYTSRDLDWLHGWVTRQCSECRIVTTQKDLVKLRDKQLGNRPLWALRIGLRVIAGKEAFDRRIRVVANALQRAA